MKTSLAITCKSWLMSCSWLFSEPHAIVILFQHRLSADFLSSPRNANGFIDIRSSSENYACTI